MKTVNDQMTTHYLVAGLWSTTDYNDKNLDERYAIRDISLEFVTKARIECQTLYDLIYDLLEVGEMSPELLGHNFWLTRNRHGAGFWDGDYTNGKEITERLQKVFKENSDELVNAIEKDEA